ncbi:MAG: hypothetical protein IPP49_05955 [Saprospiraceae bacterium]|nr:hypothetical protein [Saprospiraceae bacterium]
MKLIVSGLNGTDSLTKVIHVYDGNNGRKAPQSYSFDDDVVPAEIQRFNQDPNGVQWQTLAGTGAEQTGGCFFLQNASTNSTSTKAYFETPFFDFFCGDSNASGVNNFFIDEININNDAISGLKDQFEQNMNIYPNPSTANFILRTARNRCQQLLYRIKKFCGSIYL